jgi:hypothetical protein
MMEYNGCHVASGAGVDEDFINTMDRQTNPIGGQGGGHCQTRTNCSIGKRGLQAPLTAKLEGFIHPASPRATKLEDVFIQFLDTVLTDPGVRRGL